MKSTSRGQLEHPHTHKGFRTTQWTLVLNARDENGPQAGEGLTRLCETYWPPIYAYLRRAGHPSTDAKDLAQGFFAHLLEKDSLRNLNREKGKFRSFLLTCLQNYTRNLHIRSQAQKRGGSQTLISLDELKEDDRPFEPAHGFTPEQVFEKRWAEAVMERTIEQLQKLYVDAGKTELFEQLKNLQPDQRGTRRYAEIGAQLGLSEGAVKTAVHRMRVRHRDLLRREIASTIGAGEDVDEELRYLRQVLSR